MKIPGRSASPSLFGVTAQKACAALWPVARAARLWFGASMLVGAAMAILGTPAAAGPPAYIVEDVNGNGVYDVAVDHDVTAILRAEGSFSTPHSIIVLRALNIKHPDGLSLTAGENIWVNADLHASAPGAWLLLVAERGSVALAEKADVKAWGYVKVSAGDAIVLGRNASLRNTDDRGGLYLSAGGDVVADKGAKLLAKGGVNISTLNGHVDMDGAQMQSAESYLDVRSAGEVMITDSRVQTPSLTVVTSPDKPIAFTGNIVKFPDEGGFADFSAAQSTVDLQGTRFLHLAPDGLFIDAANVPQ